VPLQYHERLPKAPLESGKLPREQPKPPLLVLLHGRAAWAKTIFTIEGLLDPRFHIVAFQAPFMSEKGGFEWFKPEEKAAAATATTEPGGNGEMGRFAEAEKLLTNEIAQYISQHMLDDRNVFLWGFSQGAGMSLILGLRGILKPKGVVPMAGFLPAPVKAWNAFDTHSKYLLVHGTNDEVLPTSSSLSALKFLLTHGIRAEYHEYRGRHKMTLDSIAYINNWLRKEAGID
jgi:phospholipase/carboxylesterase